MRTSSPTLTTAVTSASICRANARTPTRNLAPPMPPVRTTMRMVPSSRTGMTEAAAGYRERQASPDYAVPVSPIVRQGDSVTSQPQPAPGEVKSAGQYLRQLRDLAAYVLVGATAVFLFVALVDLIPDGENQFGFRSQASFGNFINLVTIAFPLAAVLLALLVQPRHPKAQLIVLAAAIEYAVMAFFGIVFGVLIGLINEAANNGARSAFIGLLIRVAWLAVFGVAAYAVFLIWRNLFYTPKPKPQPGVYGQPQYGAPGPYQGQPGYGQPGYGPPPGQPGPAPAPNFAPGVYGQGAPSWNQPAAPPPSPYGQPGGPQGNLYPNSPGTPPAETQVVPTSEPAATQVVPTSEPAATQAVPAAHTDDRTATLPQERPGFGPADPEKPRQ
jgi:hypothetical protein